MNEISTEAAASAPTSAEQTSISINRYVGIDPGLSGAVAVVREEIDTSVVKVGFFDTPTVLVKKRKGTKREYEPANMTAILRNIEAASRGLLTVCIEKQQSMPGQGVASTFSTGYGFGLWIGILAALGISYTVVRPQTWKREMLRDMAGDTMSTGNGKAAARLRAMQLFPQVSDQLSRVKDHGRADALLLAEFHRPQLS